MRKRIIGIVLCLALMCMLLPCAFAANSVYFNPLDASSWDCWTGDERGVYNVSEDENGFIEIPENPKKDGSTFKGWGVNTTTKIVTISPEQEGKKVSFTACNVPDGGTLYAIWEANTTSSTSGSTTATNYEITSNNPTGVTLYYLKSDGSGGHATLDNNNVPEGTVVLIQAVSDETHEISLFELTDEAGVKIAYTTTTIDSKPAYKFTMPAKDVKIFISVKDIVATSITLNPTTMSISPADTGTIKATLSPDGSRITSWESSDPNVATVTQSSSDPQSVIVTGVKEGTATISVYSGTTLHADCTVTIKDRSVNFQNLPTKYVDTKSYEVNAAANPSSEKITWKSSDPTVIKVTPTNDTGTVATVQPLKTGKAQITVSIGTKGDTDYREKSESVEVSLSTQKYKVIGNGNGCWYYDAPSSYQIIVNAPYTTGISSVSIYDSQTGKTYYPVIGTDVTKQYDTNYPNQTILTFTQAFMQTLPRHTYMVLTIKFADGTASTYLHILSATGRPITGDIKFNPYWVVLALGATGMGAALTLRKKEANK